MHTEVRQVKGMREANQSEVIGSGGNFGESESPLKGIPRLKETLATELHLIAPMEDLMTPDSPFVFFQGMLEILIFMRQSQNV